MCTAILLELRAFLPCLPATSASPAMSAQLATVFEELAIKVRVQPHNLQILNHMGIDCADEFSYRLPSPQALETFLSTFFEYQVLDSGAIQHNPAPDVPARARWMQGAAA
eukprot:380488-Amphidinium_carterae.1